MIVTASRLPTTLDYFLRRPPIHGSRPPSNTGRTRFTMPGDPSYYMITAEGKNAPAPWAAWTRAGCNVGAASTANIELENVFGDISTVFASDPTELSIAQE